MPTINLQIDIDESALRDAEPHIAEANLTVASVLQSVLRRIAVDGYVSLHLFSPNAETLAAMAELDRGNGKSFPDVESLMAHLNAED
jgi:DNA-damage-inducible protein J